MVGRAKRVAYRLLDVSVSLASGEAGRAKVLRLGGGDDVGAVDQAVHVLAESRDSGEDELEVLLELRLIVCADVVRDGNAERKPRYTH